MKPESGVEARIFGARKALPWHLVYSCEAPPVENGDWQCPFSGTQVFCSGFSWIPPLLLKLNISNCPSSYKKTPTLTRDYLMTKDFNAILVKQVDSVELLPHCFRKRVNFWWQEIPSSMSGCLSLSGFAYVPSTWVRLGDGLVATCHRTGNSSRRKSAQST